LKRTLISVVAFGAVAIAIIGTANILLPNFRKSPPIATACIDAKGYELEYKNGDDITPEFSACVERHADLFLTRDLPESKDLAKSFLTLLTAVLVASITFSEKVVGVNQANWFPRALMIFCWVCILGAIIACGVGLTAMTIAGGYAAYSPFVAYVALELSALRYFVSAGVAFCLGLASLLIAGVFALSKPLDE
jgi:hypothetical protein